MNPIVEYAGYELVVFGLLLLGFGLRGSKRRAEVEVIEVERWKCKFCGTENAREDAFCARCGRSRV